VGERRAPSLRHALALGLLHGPTELLPISSSAHTTLVPWLAGWSYGELDTSERKAFEVALHAGTAMALLLRPPAARTGVKIGFLAAATSPAAIVGYALGGQVERRLGTPATIALGLLAGSAAMASGEGYAKKGRPTRTRGAAVLEIPTHLPPDTSQGPSSEAPRGRDSPTRPLASADPSDGLALGLAQALALFPGVSRSGATIATARARGFSPTDADRLSWTVGPPVIAGAGLLKGVRMARAGTPRSLRASLAVGAASAFVSTLVAGLSLSPRRRAQALPGCVVYRVALALLVVRRMRDNTR
jgi:undecaprenyl-diphosphatase